MKLATREGTDVWRPPKGSNGKAVTEMKGVVCQFLDTATTSFGRATHYNSREEQQKAELSAHESMLILDRDLYTLFLMLPGVTDRASQIGIKTLLGVPRVEESKRLLDARSERRAIELLVSAMPPQRAMKMFQAFRLGDAELGIRKANNARTRKLILRTILGSSKLELWSVKYRRKIKAALVHAWGIKTASTLQAVLRRSPAGWTRIEHRLLNKHIGHFVGAPDAITLHSAYECVSFVLGNDRALGRIDGFTVELLRVFFKARKGLANGKRLPPEVLEGIRSTYHKAVPKEEVIRLTSKSMTKTQRLQVQKRAEKAGVAVEMDPRDYDPVRLYIYIFENGVTPELEKALEEKARKAASVFPVKYGKIGILVDASRSMYGDETQRLRPMAAVLAIRDMLQFTATRGRVVYCGGSFSRGSSIPEPEGSTSLAEGLLQLLKNEPDAVFILSDGYENAPAGRTLEVLGKLRAIEVDTPIYHINPVFASEVTSVRELAPKLAPTLPVNNPGALGTTFIRGLIEAEPVRGINALVRVALPRLTEGASHDSYGNS